MNRLTFTLLRLFLITIISVLAILSGLYAQDVYVHYSNHAIYDFLDNLANDHIIEINTAIKPYSRTFVAKKLAEAKTKSDQLNKWQRKELDFYLKDYFKELDTLEYKYFFTRQIKETWNGIRHPGKEKGNSSLFSKRLDMFFYKDSNFTVTVNPIGGFRYYSNDNGSVLHRWSGAEVFSYVGEHWGFYASLRDNYESKQLASKEYLTTHPGAMYKGDFGATDYSVMLGGITYSWKWGSVGLAHDNFTWGNNYRGSNIFSGRTPPFPYLTFKINPVEWFEFSYVHGWLVSEIVDSNMSYTYTPVFNYNKRDVFYEKYLAANMFSIKPFKKLWFSVGNSIIYSDVGIQPAYLIPFLFFNSPDQAISANNNYAGQNSQFFFDISSRQIKHLHLYSSMFVDEISFKRMWDKENHSNYFSWKAGFNLTNWPVANVSLTGEYTRTNPQVYKHVIPTTTFESNKYNLGHYLRDNSEEYFARLKYFPFRGLSAEFVFVLARHGKDYEEIPGSRRWGLPFLDTTLWQNKSIQLNVSYQLIPDCYLILGFIHSNHTGNVQRFSPELYYGEINTITTGVNFGF